MNKFFDRLDHIYEVYHARVPKLIRFVTYPVWIVLAIVPVTIIFGTYYVISVIKNTYKDFQ